MGRGLIAGPVPPVSCGGSYRLLWEGEGEYPWPWEGVGLRLFGRKLLRARVERKVFPSQGGQVLLPPFREALLEVEG